MLSPLLNYHGVDDAQIRRLLGKKEPSRNEVWALETLVIKDLLKREGYTVKIRQGEA